LATNDFSRDPDDALLSVGAWTGIVVAERSNCPESPLISTFPRHIVSFAKDSPLRKTSVHPTVNPQVAGTGLKTAGTDG
jgi:hypothetical protein